MKFENEYELKAIYDSRKSFYNKANVIVYKEPQMLVLKSYNTEVAIYNKKEKSIQLRKINPKLWSQTTIRHLREFLKQNGFEANFPKWDLLKYYGICY